MVEFAELRRIAERKRQLQAQSELHRRALRAQWERLRAETAWLTRGAGILSRYRSVMWVLAPVAGFFVARHAKSFGGLFSLGQRWRDPVLVSSADGVGTKLKIARRS